MINYLLRYACQVGLIEVYYTQAGIYRVILKDARFNVISNKITNETGEKIDEFLRKYLKGENVIPEVPLLINEEISEFTKLVWEKLLEVPYGSIVSYGDLAESLGKPNAARAVGNAVGQNDIPIFIPCHRVIMSDGAIGGFSCGIKWKEYLQKLEKIKI